MEHCTCSLADILSFRVLSEAQISVILRESLEGLEYIHKLSKIHRDIKAANILLSHSGSVKLADFGVSASITTTLTHKTTFVGTPYWMSPEVILRSTHNSSADIWSLGITAIELALGTPPRSNIHPMRVLFMIPKNEAPSLSTAKHSVEFCDFVAKCLMKRASLRPSASLLLSHPFISKYASLPPSYINDTLLQPYLLYKQARPDSPSSPLPASTHNKSIDDKDTEGWDFTTTSTQTQAPKPQGILKSKKKYGTLKSGIAFADEFDDRPFDEPEVPSVVIDESLQVPVGFPKNILDVEKDEAASSITRQFTKLLKNSPVVAEELVRNLSMLVRDHGVQSVAVELVEEVNGREVIRRSKQDLIHEKLVRRWRGKYGDT